MQTDFAALTPQRKIAWSATTIKAGRDQSFFLGSNGFLGKGTQDATKPIHYVNELTQTSKGTKCILPLVHDLIGDGVGGDNTLEGNEEALSNDYVEINIDQLRNATKNTGRLSDQRTVLNFRMESKDKLAYWRADREDQLIFLAASGVPFTKNLDGSTRTDPTFSNLAFSGDVAAPSSNRAVYAGTATSTATLTASDIMSWRGLHNLRALAMRRRLKPIRNGGRAYYVVVMSPEQFRDLSNDTDYKNIVSQAGTRGEKNPLFKGEAAQVGGLIIYEHQKIYNTLGLASGSKWGAASTVDGAQALLIGAQGIGYAHIGSDEWNESDNRDYGNRIGIAYSTMIGVVKNKFLSNYDLDASGLRTRQDFSIISYYTAAKPIA